MIKHVSIKKCDDYEPFRIREAVRSSLEIFGGMKSFVRKGDSVLLKVNMLQGAEPDKAVTTHPAVVSAVAELVMECGAVPFIADSPGSGFPYIPMVLMNIYKKCGFWNVAEKLGIKCNMDVSSELVTLENPLLIKKMDIIKPALTADVIINLPKAKTHEYTYMSGAVKNMFGMIPGFQKPGFHSKLKKPENFSLMLLDICNLLKPAINIVDAVVGMEGNGPMAGSPKKMGTIIAGIDPLRVDVVLATIMGMNPLRVPTISAGASAGLTTGKPDSVIVTGDYNRPEKIHGFRLPMTLAGGDGFEKLLNPFQCLFRGYFSDMFTVKPMILRDKCTGCGACRNACPESAIILEDGKAKILYEKCIRCYCCHEMCPHSAIDLKRSILNRIVRIFSQ